MKRKLLCSLIAGLGLVAGGAAQAAIPNGVVKVGVMSDMSGPYAAALSQSSRFVMLFRLTPSVDALCKSADVAGGRMPMAPRTMRVLLKLMIKR